MKKICCKLLALVVMTSFLFSGCAKMYSISEDDEERIAVYSAGVINKFNRMQSRGVVPVVMRPEVPETEVNTDDPENPESGSPAEFPKDPTDVNAPTSNGGDSTLSDIIGIPGVSFSYSNTVISEDYGMDGGFLISPQTGNSFVAVKYQVRNLSSEEINCNIMQRSLNFTASLGEVTSAVDRTILPDDLSTFNGTIGPEGSVELALLFQFPTAYVSDLSGLTISCIKDGVKYQVPF